MTYKVISGTAGTLHEGDSLREALATFWDLVEEAGEGSYSYNGTAFTLYKGEEVLKEVSADKPN